MFFRIFLKPKYFWVWNLVSLGFWVWCLGFFGSLGLGYGYGLKPKPKPKKPNKTQTTSSVSLDTLGIKRLSVVNVFNYFFLKYLNNTEILKNH